MIYTSVYILQTWIQLLHLYITISKKQSLISRINHIIVSLTKKLEPHLIVAHFCDLQAIKELLLPNTWISYDYSKWYLFKNETWFQHIVSIYLYAMAKMIDTWIFLKSRLFCIQPTWSSKFTIGQSTSKAFLMWYETVQSYFCNVFHIFESYF